MFELNHEHSKERRLSPVIEALFLFKPHYDDRDGNVRWNNTK